MIHAMTLDPQVCLRGQVAYSDLESDGKGQASYVHFRGLVASRCN